MNEKGSLYGKLKPNQVYHRDTEGTEKKSGIAGLRSQVSGLRSQVSGLRFQV
jgi:hypothetical protein